MSYDNDDEQTHLRYTCSVCLNELDSSAGPETCPCGAEYDKSGQRIWPDDPLRDLQTM